MKEKGFSIGAGNAPMDVSALQVRQGNTRLNTKSFEDLPEQDIS